MTSAKKMWKILVVDDDPDVLTNTKFTLMGLKVLGRELVITTIQSAAAAVELLGKEDGFAVILVDVVMESPHAGLALVSTIRDVMKMQMTRIILRTGYPGNAPAMDVVIKLGIDDYIHKQSGDRERLITAVVAAIRAYKQIWRLERMKAAMEMIVECSNQLLGAEEVGVFANICMRYLPGIMGEGSSGALAYSGSSSGVEIGPLKVIAATCEHTGLVDQTSNVGGLSTKQSSAPKEMMLKVIMTNTSIKTATQWAIRIVISPTEAAVLWIKKPGGFDDLDERIGNYFSSTVKVCLDRLGMLRKRLDAAMVTMGILAHEFRTPLATLSMSIDFIREAINSNKIHSNRILPLLKNSEQTISRMNSHIDSTIKNVGILLKEQLQLPPDRQDLGAIVRETLEINKLLFSKTGELLVSIENDCWVETDKATLEQVFLNLMSNAVKAQALSKKTSSKPQIEITVRKQGEQVSLKVTDQGVGIPPDQIGHIFQPFYSSSAMPSHGLGLTMAKKAVNAMGGSISCSSTVGVGTTFEILLPRAAQAGKKNLQKCVTDTANLC
jgi:signal transduction histidine kinase/CheY-like chemotaxis protein